MNHFSLERKFQSLHGEQIVQFVGKKVCRKFLQIYMPVGRVLHTQFFGLKLCKAIKNFHVVPDQYGKFERAFE